MTYNEIYDSDDDDVALSKESVATRQAWAALMTLKDRGGFEGWFEDIDPETQDELFAAMCEAVKSVK